jgi:maltooligosyltrehalose trehalohydrolase
LRWADLQAAPAQRRLALVRQLLALRRRHVVSRLAGPVQASVTPGPGSLLQVAWRFGDGAVLTLQANLSADSVPAARPAGTCLWGEGTSDALPPWHVGWFLAAP